MLEGVTVTTRSEIRKLRESAMPISVIGQQQLQGTASNINDVLARTVGVTVRKYWWYGKCISNICSWIGRKANGNIYRRNAYVAAKQLRGIKRYPHKYDRTN